MFLTFYSPNILAISSSRVNEDSLSHHGDSRIGVYVIDRYTFYVLQFLERVRPDSDVSMHEFFKVGITLLENLCTYPFLPIFPSFS